MVDRTPPSAPERSRIASAPKASPTQRTLLSILGASPPDMPMPTELAAVPTRQDRAGQLAARGWKERDAEWLALVAFHSGVFLRSQWCRYFEHVNRDAARVLVHQLIDKQLAIEDARAVPWRRARRAAHRETDLSGTRHRGRAAPPRQTGIADAAHAPGALARLPHRSAEPRMAPS